MAAASAPLLRAMRDLSRLMPPEYQDATNRAIETLKGKAERRVDRFAREAALRGGALRYGVELARRHKRELDAAASEEEEPNGISYARV